jgi:adenylate cyclase
MADLTAQGPRPEDRWRRALPIGSDPITVGREGTSWSVPWDDRISRAHVRIHAEGGHWVVEKLPAARNPVFFRGQRRDRFTVHAGEHFVIGRTTFTVGHPPKPNPAAVAAIDERTFDRAQLRRQPFRDAGRRIDVLSKIPDLIASSGSDDELFGRLTALLLQGIPDALSVAVVQLDRSLQSEGPRVLHWDSRLPDAAAPGPSSRLIMRALAQGESVLHLWAGAGDGMFTESEGVDWAFCVPVEDEAHEGWALYVAGSLPVATSAPGMTKRGDLAATDLADEVKFAELAATTLGNLRKMRHLERRQAGLRPFFAPVVMDAMSGRDPESVLAPTTAELAVMFCDLRGFSQHSEASAGKLLELLERVSQALGLMTRHILDRDGVIGDFHGDAAMGFWGWPLGQPDAAGRACRAALDVAEAFARTARQPGHPLQSFRCGIGVAFGTAVAGRIGTTDQVKVTAFGPVVNLASRLEGMTKRLNAEILIDEATASYVRQYLPATVARVRKLARVRPAGMQQPVMVHQLLPPHGERSKITDADLVAYEGAVDALIAGDWGAAFEQLHEVPPHDHVKDFMTGLIAQHGRQPPAGWNGVIELLK